MITTLLLAVALQNAPMSNTMQTPPAQTTPPATDSSMSTPPASTTQGADVPRCSATVTDGCMEGGKMSGHKMSAHKTSKKAMHHKKTMHKTTMKTGGAAKSDATATTK